MKCNNTLVKRLRKAGYKTSEAMRIATEAHNNFFTLRDFPNCKAGRKEWRNLAGRGSISGMFVWRDSKEGHNYWGKVCWNCDTSA